MHKSKNNRDILEDYGMYVKGHTEAKKAIINLINRSKMRYYQKYVHLESQHNLLEPSKILLMGNTGEGKTHLVETASRMLSFPLVKIDATVLAPSSTSKGVNAQELVDMIRVNAANLVSTSKEYHSEQGVIDQTVVFIDEIDKLAKSYDSSGRWNIHVQESFLTMLDTRQGDLAGVSFILAGAFTGIDDESIGSKRIGFTKENDSKNGDVSWDEKVIAYGLIPEFVGRLKTIVKLDKLTKLQYKEILVDVLLPKKCAELIYFNHAGYYLKEHQINEIVDIAYKSGQGVRSLKRELDKLTTDLEFYYEDVTSEYLMLESMTDRFGCQSE